MKKSFLETIADKTFFTSVIIILFINFILVVGYVGYDRYLRGLLLFEEAPQHVVNIIQLIRVTPIKWQNHVVTTSKYPNTKINITTTPLWATRVDGEDYLHQVYNQFAQRHQRLMRISYKLSEKRWLNIEVDVYPKLRAFTIILLAIEFLMVMATIVYMWTLMRFVKPLRNLKSVVEKVGDDLNPRLLPVHGPLILQEVLSAVNHMQMRIIDLIKERTLTLAALSHDLRTPITRLELRAQFIEDEEQRESLLRDIGVVEKIVHDTLIFAKQNYQPQKKHLLDLVSLISTICEEMQDVQFDVTLQSEVARLSFLGEPISLRRAFTNLIENAIKYGKKADVQLLKKRDQVIIQIKDEGPGIPEDQFEKVFLPFYRTDTSRSMDVKGSGLGLALANTIIRSHHGTIQLKNLPQGGLLVEIVFRIDKSH